MRYVALQRLTYMGQDGITHTVLPGQPVLEFESWGSAIRHAHLASHFVRDTQALGPEIVGGVLRMAVPMQAAAEPIEPKVQAPSTTQVVAEDILHEADVAADRHVCPHCDHPGFAVKNSLAQHIKRKH